MKIESTNKHPFLFNKELEKPSTGKTEAGNNQPAPGKNVDKIVISQEAKKLHINGAAGKDYEAIKEKINNNFYNSDEVLNKVAESILKEVQE